VRSVVNLGFPGRQLWTKIVLESGGGQEIRGDDHRDVIASSFIRKPVSNWNLARQCLRLAAPAALLLSGLGPVFLSVAPTAPVPSLSHEPSLSHDAHAPFRRGEEPPHARALSRAVAARTRTHSSPHAFYTRLSKGAL
jgi:hypothetical protein